MRVSKLPASQQLVGTATPAFDQPRTPALPLQIVCHLLGSGNQLHPPGPHQPAATLSHCTHNSPPGAADTALHMASRTYLLLTMSNCTCFNRYPGAGGSLAPSRALLPACAVRCSGAQINGRWRLPGHSVAQQPTHHGTRQTHVCHRCCRSVRPRRACEATTLSKRQMQSWIRTSPVLRHENIETLARRTLSKQRHLI